MSEHQQGFVPNLAQNPHDSPSSSSSPSPRKERGQGGEVRAIVFDIDGVLLDSHAANMAYYRDILARHGFPPATDAELAYGHSHTLRESIAYLTKAEEAAVDAIFEAIRDLAGYPYELVRQPEACIEVLEALSADYALGVMSSRIIEGIRQYLDISGTHERFSTLVGYEDTTHHKPHAEPLLLACERLGVPPEATVYVGDAPTDMACARSAGAHFIAFGDAIPDAAHVITHFDDLASAIRRLGQTRARDTGAASDPFVLRLSKDEGRDRPVHPSDVKATPPSDRQRHE
jgi:phosphoglycolate phosphatase-like HAD superfamily hydrolase